MPVMLATIWKLSSRNLHFSTLTLNLSFSGRSLFPRKIFWQTYSSSTTERKLGLPKEDDTGLNEDVTQEILLHWNKPASPLPDVKDLGQYVNKPFHERAKIPLTRTRFQAFLTNEMDARDGVVWQDLEKVFRVDDNEHAVGLDLLFTSSILGSPPGDDATENLFHSFWDINIRHIIQRIIPQGVSIRGTERFTSTAAKRPDFAFLYDKICLFRGEEKSPSSYVDPRYELSSKMKWTYDPAPYVLGYYAIGSRVTLVAIFPPLHRSKQNNLQVFEVVETDLWSKANRIMNLVRLVNLFSLVLPITAIIGRPRIPEFTPIIRDGRTIEVCGTNIKKTYDGPDRHRRLQKLRKVYDILRRKDVPNVDQIDVSYSDDKRGVVAFFEPKGISVMPKTTRQVLEAVSCILDALNVMHKDPEPIFHRDVQWPNVVRSAEDKKKWFLIDWDDAATPPTLAAKHFDHRTHAPAVFEDSHGAEVDLWGVGRLIIEISRILPDFPSEILEVGKDMQSGRLNVSQSIQKILALKRVVKDDKE